MIKITCVMSVYNEEIWMINRAVESILNQSYSVKEIIIVVDNQDYRDAIKTLEKYKSNSKTEIKIIINKKNVGLAKSLNIAIAEAQYDYICRMDADDESEVNRIEEELNFLRNNGLDLVGSLMATVDEDGTIICEKIQLPYRERDIKKISKYSGCLCHPTWLFKKEVWESIGGYREAMLAAQDGDFILRAIKQGFRIANINKVLLKYTVRKTSITGNNTAKQSFLATYARDCVLKNRVFDQKISEKIRDDSCESYSCFKVFYENGMVKYNTKVIIQGMIMSYYFRCYIRNIIIDKMLRRWCLSVNNNMKRK